MAGGDIRGSATGVDEWDVLSPMHVTPMIHGVVFSGGSAFGLESASGVRRFLEHKGVGFKTGAGPVPIVVGAILFDLGFGKKSVRPTREMAETAAAAATDKAVVEGAVGAGTGATVGKILGMKQAMKSGVGSWTVTLEGRNAGVMVSALAVVNALGDVRDPATGKIIAGARKTAGVLRRCGFCRQRAADEEHGADRVHAREHDSGGGGDQRGSHQSGSDQAGAAGAIGMSRAPSIR